MAAQVPSVKRKAAPLRALGTPSRAIHLDPPALPLAAPPAEDAYQSPERLGSPLARAYEGTLTQDLVTPEHRDSIENKIEGSSFEIVAKIFVRDASGRVSVRYVKVRTVDGYSAYIDMDKEGYLASEDSPPILVETPPTPLIQHSVKMGMYQAARTETEGIAFECDTFLCVISQAAETREPHEQNFSLPSALPAEGAPAPAPALAGACVCVNKIAYPVIKLTHLLANPYATAEYIEIASKRIRNQEYAHLQEALSNNVASIQRLSAAYDTFNQRQQQLFKDLSEKIKKVRTYLDPYKTNPPKTAQEKEKYHTIVYNLQRRNELIVDLLRMGHDVSQNLARVDELTHELGSADETIKTHFRGSEYVMYRD